MHSERIVVSLGGNALGYEPEEQLTNTRKAASVIADLAEEGYQIVITHGNGPQVGLVNLAFENSNVPSMPFAECGAMTQGYIGYHLQQCLKNELMKRNISKECISIVTQVMVDENDPAFSDPSKPIGSFLSREEAEKREKENHYVYKEDARRGYRRVVASPAPIDILEKESVSQLMKKQIVICCGGGGIPVIQTKEGYEGIAAVIDKDRTSALLADLIDADILLILTAVDSACLNYGQENETKLHQVNKKQMEEYLLQGHFAKGSMLPKVEACLSFVKDSSSRTAIITSLEQAKQAMKKETGTHICNC